MWACLAGRGVEIGGPGIQIFTKFFVCTLQNSEPSQARKIFSGGAREEENAGKVLEFLFAHGCGSSMGLLVLCMPSALWRCKLGSLVLSRAKRKETKEDGL